VLSAAEEEALIKALLEGYGRQIGLLSKPGLADPQPDGMFPSALKESHSFEGVA